MGNGEGAGVFPHSPWPASPDHRIKTAAAQCLERLRRIPTVSYGLWSQAGEELKAGANRFRKCLRIVAHTSRPLQRSNCQAQMSPMMAWPPELQRHAQSPT